MVPKYRLAVFQFHVSNGKNKINIQELWKEKEIETRGKQGGNGQRSKLLKVPHCLTESSICWLSKSFVWHSKPQFSWNSEIFQISNYSTVCKPAVQHTASPWEHPATFSRSASNLDFDYIFTVIILTQKFYLVSQDPPLGPCPQQSPFIFLNYWHPSEKLITLLSEKIISQCQRWFSCLCRVRRGQRESKEKVDVVYSSQTQQIEGSRNTD